MYKILTPNQEADPGKILYEYYCYHIPSKTLCEGRVEVLRTVDFLNFLSDMNKSHSPDCVTWKYWMK